MNSKNSFPAALVLFIWSGLAASPASGQELRVFLNENCVVADEPIVIPDAVASKGMPYGPLIVSDAGQAVIRVLVKGIAMGLAKISSRRDYNYTASEELYLYNVNFDIQPQPQLNSSLSCMTLVAGSFERRGADCVADYEPLVLTDAAAANASLLDLRRGRSSANVLRRANICMNGEPDILIENRVVLSDDESAFRLQGAGREINRLLSTDKKKSKRGLLLTATLFAPARDGRGERLSTHWVNYGMVGPHGRIHEYADAAISSWTPVPPMTGTVLENYSAGSAEHRQASDRASSLERSILRQSRQVSELESRLENADATLEPILRKRLGFLNGNIEAQSAELNAWRQEYDDLPGDTYRYMPVTLQLTLTETRDEKRLLLALARLLDANSRNIAKSIGDSDRWND